MKDDYEYDVFISYDSQDPTAESIAARLRGDRLRVFFAPRSIEPGAHFWSAINDALEKSRRVACFMTQRAYESEWVSYEIGRVLSNHPMNRADRLIPVKLDSTPVPSGLQDLHFIDWYRDPAGAYAELLEKCRPSQESPLLQDPAVTAAPLTLGEILALCNRAARSLFDEHVYGIATGGDAGFPRERAILAGRYWGRDEYETQRQYERIRLAATPEFLQQKARQLLHDAFTSNAPTHLWIIGDAGTGKTTAMYRMYVDILEVLDRSERDGQPAPYPFPMLFQPQKMDERIIERLRATETENDFIATLFDLWLARRQIDVAHSDRPKLHAEFIEALRRGKIVLFIDSYDELGRMDIQLDGFRRILNMAKHYFCATRPEMYVEAPEHQVLRISSTWDISTIRNHLERVFPDAPEVGRALAGYIASKDKILWLRNPRYLKMLSRILAQRVRTDDASAADVLEVIEQGQYKLLDYLYKATIQRLHSIAPNRRFSLIGEALEREVRRRLQKIAQSQVETGTLRISEGLDDIWTLLASNASEIVARRVDHASSDDHFYLVSYNWIDFFLVDLVLHDLFMPASAPPSVSHVWTQTLLTYASEAARDHPEALQFPELIREKLTFLRETLPEETRRNMDINLVQLLVRTTAAQRGTADDKGHSHESCFDDEDFSRLDLHSIDFHRLLFRQCNFSGTRLMKANLERATFEECDFSGADLRQANADHAVFVDCTFTLDRTPSAVVGMSMQGATVTDRGEDRFETFKRLGVITYRSRYQSPFGKLFFEKQKQMLGPGLQRTEQSYLRAIRAALDASPGDRKYLVDVMAGGGNKRLIDLLERDTSLRVLAIDRDGRDMNEIVSRVGARFAMVEKEITGEIDIGALLAETFGVSSADLVIGKKAIHEIPRAAQAELIASAADVLRDRGRLVLFTDSPYETDAEGRERLTALRNLLISYEDRDLGALRDELLALRFDAWSLSDLAVFSNLWVHLKDWANENEQELRNRYFSGVHEIRAWAQAAGLRPLDPAYNDHYQLVARRFNEAGFNQACHRLEESRGVIPDREIGFYRDKLEGSQRFRLFCEVVEHHLWDAGHGRPTALGAALHARPETIRFHELNSALRAERLALSYDTGIGFDFTIHVLAFERSG